ncbi:MAG: hypothetical protein J6Y94_01750, partial [Bacteriovoracaceae bacterium]|nr:hypothetical protein [Bacteriovoracaceae bacterium]
MKNLMNYLKFGLKFFESLRVVLPIWALAYLVLGLPAKAFGATALPPEGTKQGVNPRTQILPHHNSPLSPQIKALMDLEDKFRQQKFANAYEREKAYGHILDQVKAYLESIGVVALRHTVDAPAEDNNPLGRSWLTIAPGEQSPLNRLAQQLSAHDYFLVYFTVGQLATERLAIKQILVRDPIRRWYFSALAFYETDKLLDSRIVKSNLRILQGDDLPVWAKTVFNDFAYSYEHPASRPTLKESSPFPFTSFVLSKDWKIYVPLLDENHGGINPRMTYWLLDIYKATM